MENMKRPKNKALYDRVARYIEEHYEGIWGAYEFSHPAGEEEAPQRRTSPEIRYSLSELKKENPRPMFSFDEEVCRPDEPDPFDDIFEIFKDRRDGDSKTDSPKETLSQYVERVFHEETFSEYMLRMISEKGYTEPEVYSSVFMDRRLFNKIRNDVSYQPSKRTALLLAIGLKLDLAQTETLLSKAGFTLTHCSKTDLIVEFFIKDGNYDIFAINEMLHEFGMPLLMKCD